MLNLSNIEKVTVGAIKAAGFVLPIVAGSAATLVTKMVLTDFVNIKTDKKILKFFLKYGISGIAGLVGARVVADQKHQYEELAVATKNAFGAIIEMKTNKTKKSATK